MLTLTIEDGVTTVAISPDTKYVAAGSLDKSVRVWEIAHGYLAERLEGPDGHKDSVYSVAFSPSGKELVSGSLDRTIKMWELSAARGIPNQGPKGGRCIKTFEGHRVSRPEGSPSPRGWLLTALRRTLFSPSPSRPMPSGSCRALRTGACSSGTLGAATRS